MKVLKLVAISLFLINVGYGKGPTPAMIEEEMPQAPILPWFTGPLLAPSGYVTPVGKYNIEPYLYATCNYGNFDAHWKGHSSSKLIQVIPQFQMNVGVVNRVEYQFVLEGFYNHAEKGGSAWRYGDMEMGFNIQLFDSTPTDWYPAIKIGIKEVFPTGQYQKLNPHKHGADISGAGSYQTGICMGLSELFHFSGIHYLNARLYFSYFFPAPVHVKGFNVYGGGFGTKGKVRPGNVFNTIFGMEFSLTQRWALALDVMNSYQNKTRFSGKRGISREGERATVGVPSMNQISLAPAIEYNFNENLGVIAGGWFTIAGRNSIEFVSGVIAVNIYGSFKN